MLNLTTKQKVLDVGCGIGGGDFYMAKVSQRLTYDGFMCCHRTCFTLFKFTFLRTFKLSRDVNVMKHKFSLISILTGVGLQSNYFIIHWSFMIIHSCFF